MYFALGRRRPFAWAIRGTALHRSGPAPRKAPEPAGGGALAAALRRAREGK